MTVSKRLDPDEAQHFVVLIWVKFVCKGYRQTTLVGNELICEACTSVFQPIQVECLIIYHQFNNFCV